MKLHRRQVWLLAVVTLVLVVTAAGVMHHQRVKRAVADYRNQLIAQGEILDVEGLIPKPVPPEQNGASLFLQAMTKLTWSVGVLTSNEPRGMTMVAPGRARVGFAQPNIRSTDATNTWEEADQELARLADALAELEGLIERPYLNCNVNYRMGFSVPLPNLAQIKQAAQYLSYAAVCDLHRGDTTAATRRMRALLAISQGSTDQRLLIAQLVRIAVTAIGAGSTWELLQAPGVTDAQLAQIQSDWTRLEFTRAAENSLAMERAMGQMTLEQMRESSAEFRKFTSGFAWPGAAPAATGSDWFDQAEQFAKDAWDQSRLKAKETAWRFSWSYSDQLRTLRAQQALIECARQARTNGSFAAALAVQKEKWEALGLDGIETDDLFNLGMADADLRTLFTQTTLALTKFIDKVMVVEANRQLVVTAIALQRYKLRNRQYPTALAALVPAFLSALPRDPVDGKPLRYQPNTDGTLLLYSVGEDGEDNGGDPKPAKEGSKNLAWQLGRDWVWPQPATQQEIEDYFRRESKRSGN